LSSSSFVFFAPKKMMTALLLSSFSNFLLLWKR
jgi:hypothetical protein